MTTKFSHCLRKSILCLGISSLAPFAHSFQVLGNACLDLTVADVLANSESARKDLAEHHTAILDTRVIPKHAIYLRELYFAQNHNLEPRRLGTQVDLDLFDLKPRFGAMTSLARPEGLAREALKLLGASTLAALQKTFPQEKLGIRRMYFSVGYNASNSIVHVDAGLIYLHAIYAAAGDAPYRFTRAGMAKLDYFDFSHTGGLNRKANGFVLGEDLTTGELRVLVGASPNDPNGRVVHLASNEYSQAEIGQTTIITGTERSDSKRIGLATGHSSPVFNATSPRDNRVTVFMDIGPID